MDGSKDRGLAAMRTDDVRTAELEALEAERAGARPSAPRPAAALIGERPAAFVVPPAEAPAKKAEKPEKAARPAKAEKPAKAREAREG